MKFCSSSSSYVDGSSFVSGDEKSGFVFDAFGVVFQFVEERALYLSKFCRSYHFEHVVFKFL